MLIGLVGKPSCGKSTFFKAATLAEVEIASYPFTTIKANHGVGYVRLDCPDKDFDVKCEPNHGFCINGQRFVPIELMDVAGLVPGAHTGKGLGNQFLDDLRQADLFIHIVDCSGETDNEGKPTKNHNVCSDVEFLEEELDKWFYNILLKAWKSFARKVEQEESFAQAVEKQFSGLKVREDQVKAVMSRLDFKERPSSWKDEQLMEFASALRKESKPMIIAANKIDLEKGRENYEKLKEKFPDLLIEPCSADSELALRQAAKVGIVKYVPGDSHFEIKNVSDKQKQALDKIKKNVLDRFGSTGVQRVLNAAVFDFLEYIAVYPVENPNKLTDSKGKILPDCFLLPPKSTALDFAYHLHTDFGKNFIKAIDARTKKVLGKAYELKNGDVLQIVTR
jgi:hypothetical protein